MRSRASYKGHPIHPALIPFPFAFLTGALVFDLLAWLGDWPPGGTTGAYLALAGIVTALVAAVPGTVDYVYTVPPRSSGKRRATRHMLLNLGAVALVAVAWALRQDEPALRATPTTLLLETLGVGLLITGAWMGGTLVNRNQIGVDHRYAGAGKWREATLPCRPGTPVTAARIDELQLNQMKLLRARHRRVALGRTERGYVAFDDRCPHRGGSLAGGALICSVVQCPWHGSQFDVHTGAVIAGPATDPIPVRPTEVANGDVRVTM
jgi:uncharacterized membrane protein/nitrite reductase/ring-hydroxylating ferredoxin subunit